MELELTELVLMVLASSIGVVLVFGLISRSSRVAGESRAASKRVTCRLCLHVFEDESQGGPGGLVECPQCGARNERGKDRRPC